MVAYRAETERPTFADDDRRRTLQVTHFILEFVRLPGQTVLAALDAPPLVIADAQALMRDPTAEATRIVAGVAGLTAWRRALAETALRRAVEMAVGP